MPSQNESDGPPEATDLISRSVSAADARLRAILDSALDALITIDSRGRIVEFNRAAETTFGYTRPEVIGLEMGAVIVPPSLREGHRIGMAHYLRTGEGPILDRRIEITAMRRDGTLFPVELTVTRVPLGAGEAPLFTGALRDITDRKRSEDRRAAQYAVTSILARSGSLEHAGPELLAAIGGGLRWEFGQLWLPDGGGRLLRWEASWSLEPDRFRAFEASSRESTFSAGSGLPGRVWRDGAPAWLEAVTEDPNFPRQNAARAAGIVTGFAIPVRTRDGSIAVLEFFTSEPRQTDEDLLRFVDALGRQIGDFVERYTAENLVRESEDRFRKILETTNEGVWWIDKGSRTIFVNDRMAAMLGTRPDLMLGTTVFDYLDGPQQEEVRAFLQRRQEGISEQFDLQFRRQDGSALWVIVSASPVLGADGRFAGSLAMLTDITARKRAEQADRFLLEVAHALGSSLDTRATLRQLADLAVPTIGDWCQVELVGDDGSLDPIAISHVDPEKVDLARRMNEEYPAGADATLGAPQVARTGEAELISEIPDGLLASAARSPEHLEMLRSLGMVSYVCVPIVLRDTVLGTIGFVSAESGRRYDGADLLLAHRVAALAATAMDNARLYAEAGAAVRLRDDFLSIAGHELRTPLTTLSLDLYRLLRRSDAAGDVETAAIAVKARRAAERLSRQIDQLLDVSRLSAGRMRIEPEELDLAGLTRELIAQHEDELARKGSRLDLRIQEPVVGVWDRRGMEQVVGNLLSNAIKYGEGRPIGVELRSEGPDAVLGVRDHGIGIAPQDAGRIFERFERAVSDRHFGGLGLGLWIANEIVRASGGTLEVKSAPGEGSTFTLRIPLMPAAEAER
ncbi:MAG: PAS domain S-box protein [Thermoanaerobaculia bacterium]